MALASLYNFADDNTAFAMAVSRLIKILVSEPEVVIDCFKKNKMVGNPGKLQAMMLDKQKSGHINGRITLIISKLNLCHL